MNVGESIGVVETAIEGNGAVGRVALVDHAAAAASVEAALRPTSVILFGDPALGTPLMQENRLAGLDRPQKLLVFDENEVVTIAWNDPAWVAARHGIEGLDEVNATIAGALAGEGDDDG